MPNLALYRQRNACYQVYGGHLIQGVVGGVAEITIVPLPNKITRKVDPKTGIASMQTATVSTQQNVSQ